MEALARALSDWTQLLGPAAVDGDTTAFRSPDPTRGVLAVLRPTDARQVPGILRVAREHGLPLHPVSTGRNWGYGGAAPPGGHCVLLDLSGLARILDIDATLGTATIEPGVTQGQLHAELERRGLALMVPTTGAGPSVSLVGNALERGYGITPHEDHFGAVNALEAVLPDGTVYRSRLAALGGDRVDRCYKWGVGPYLDGLFSQGNFGVVTRMTIALARRPAHLEAFYLILRDAADLGPVVDDLRELQATCRGALGGINVLNGYRVASLACPYPEDLRYPGGFLPPERLRELLRQEGLGPHLVAGCVYGMPGPARAVLREVRRRLGSRGRFITMTRERTRRIAWMVERWPRLRHLPALAKFDRMMRGVRVMDGIPDDVALQLLRWKSGGVADDDIAGAMQRGELGLLWYSPLVPMVSSVVEAFQEAVGAVCLAHGFEPLITMTSLSERCMDSSVALLFDPRAEGQAERARRCYEALFDEGRRLGLLPYRVGVDAFHKLEAADDGGLDLARRIKGLLDPQGLVSPGRYNL